MPKSSNIETKTKCLPLYSENYDHKIKDYTYEIREKKVISKIKKPTFELGQKLLSLKTQDPNEIKNKIK